MLRADYLSTVAQIIPLLTITIIVERRFLPDSPKHALFATAVDAFCGITLIAFVFTEGEVLWGLHRGHAPKMIDDDVRAALIIAGIALLAPVIHRAIARGVRGRGKAYALGTVAFIAIWVSAGIVSR
jgi:hypothetical protein